MENFGSFIDEAGTIGSDLNQTSHTTIQTNSSQTK